MDLKTLQTLQSEIEELLEVLGVDFVDPSVEVGEDEIIKVDLQLAGEVGNIDEAAAPNVGILIGSRGETLSALEYILGLSVNRDRDGWLQLQIDVDGYREKRLGDLIDLATRMAERALREEEAVTLQPMPNYERKVIHSALSDHAEVETESTGEGRGRRIVIKPL